MRRFQALVPVFLLLFGATALAHDHSHHRDRSVSFDDGDDMRATDCSALRVRFDGDRVPVVSENVAVGNVSSLRVRSGNNGGVRVIGTTGRGYSVTACKAAASGIDAGQIHTAFDGSEVSATGPENDDWLVYFIVQTPSNATLDVTASNGPISVADFSGNLTAHAHNGPVGLKNSSGTIDASTINGPISIEGGNGNVKLTASNGPLSVKLDGTTWQGGSLDGSTKNGPVSLRMPRGYLSGVVVESLGHGPVSCHAEGCAQARLRANEDRDDDMPRRIELGSGAAAVHLSTVNGPVSVKDRD